MKLWNTLVEHRQRRKGPLPANVHTLTEFRLVESGEHFGLVKMSTKTTTQYSLTTIKWEPEDEALDLSLQVILDPDRILEEIGVDSVLLRTPVFEPAPSRDAPLLISSALGSGTAASASVFKPVAALPAPVGPLLVPEVNPRGKGVRTDFFLQRTSC